VSGGRWHERAQRQQYLTGGGSGSASDSVGGRDVGVFIPHAVRVTGPADPLYQSERGAGRL
jgi:hypothetical protein